MPDRAREDADGARRRDDAAVRSMSGAAPCGRKESGDDGGRVGRRGGRDCSGGCGSFAVAQSADKSAEQELAVCKEAVREPKLWRSDLMSINCLNNQISKARHCSPLILSS